MLSPSTIRTIGPEQTEFIDTLADLREEFGYDVLSVIDDADESAERHTEHDEWVHTVRDPSEKNAEGFRRIRSGNKKAFAAYRVAPLPDGQWGLQTEMNYAYGCGSDSCWEAYDTRAACVQEFLDRALRFFQEKPSSSTSQTGIEAWRQMQPLLAGEGLFGFMEPEVDKKYTAWCDELVADLGED